MVVCLHSYHPRLVANNPPVSALHDVSLLVVWVGIFECILISCTVVVYLTRLLQHFNSNLFRIATCLTKWCLPKAVQNNITSIYQPQGWATLFNETNDFVRQVTYFWHFHDATIDTRHSSSWSVIESVRRLRLHFTLIFKKTVVKTQLNIEVIVSGRLWTAVFQKKFPGDALNF